VRQDAEACFGQAFGGPCDDHCVDRIADTSFPPTSWSQVSSVASPWLDSELVGLEEHPWTIRHPPVVGD